MKSFTGASYAPLTDYLLDEPVKLLFVFRAAEVGGPGVADGKLVELQHVHDSYLSHSAAEQLGPLVHTGRWGMERTQTDSLETAVLNKKQKKTPKHPALHVVI